MHTKYKHPKVLVFSACLALATTSGIVSYVINTADSETLRHAAPMGSGAYMPCESCAAEAVSTDMDSTAAKRLQQRLMSESGAAPGIAVLDHALKEKARFIRQTVTMTVTDPAHADAAPATWTVNFGQNPELITLRSTWATASFGIDRALFAEYLKSGKFGAEGHVQSIVVNESVVDGKVTRAPNVSIARDGYDYDANEVADAFEKALRNGTSSIEMQIPFKRGTVQVSIDGELRELDLLSVGRSDFSNSPDERIWNVYKATNEHVNNVIIPKGATYSFVDVLGGPVTTQKGWKEAMGLFGGGAAMTPGAGICQLATTVYRAALLAGMPITYRRYHSMFVDHYETYGVGLDATIFPGVHDMTFKNDTADILFIQSYTIGDDVIVNLYGEDDGRTVALDGPYFNTTPGRPKEIRPLDYDEIGWVNTVTYPDGSKKVKAILSTYVKGFARSVKEKYAGTPGIVLLSLPGGAHEQTVATTATSLP